MTRRGIATLLAAAIAPAACLGAGAATTQPATAPAEDRVAVEKALDDLAGGDWVIQWDAIARLAQMKSKAAVGPLRETLAKHPSAWMRGKALLALAEIQGAATLDSAVRLSADPSDDLREAAVQALGVIGAAELSAPQAERAAAAATERLKDTVSSIRCKALLSYARIRRSGAWDEVAKALAGSDSELSATAIRAMAYVGTAESRKKLMELLDQRSTETRLAAARAMKEARDPETVVAILERAVVEKEKQVRAALEAALQAFDREQLTAPCLRILKTEQAAIYPTALRLLAANPTREVGAEVASRMGTISEKCPESLPTAIGILARVDPDAHRDVLAAQLNHKQAEVRLAAVEGLAQCKKADLYALFRDRLVDTDLSVRTAAFEALRSPNQRPPEGGLVEYLSDALKSADASVCWSAVSLLRGRLARAEFPKAAEALDRFLGGSDDKSRELAASVLAGAAGAGKLRQIALAQGYVMNWSVIGPFPNDADNTGLAAAYEPEQEIDFDKKYKGLEDKEVSWLRQELNQLDGTLDLSALFWEKSPYKAAYATVELKSQTEQSAALNAEGAGAFVVWLNDKKAGQAAEGGKQQVALTLQKGANRLLVKSCKSTQSGSWWFKVRLTDKVGQRISGVTVGK